MKTTFLTCICITISFSLSAQHLDWAVSKKLATSTTQYAMDLKASHTSDATFVFGTYYEDTLNTGVLFQNGPSYVFLAKVDASGDTVWKWNNSTTSTAAGSGMFPGSIAVDDHDNIYMTGFYSLLDNSLTISVDTFQMPLSPFYYGGFLAKFDSTGHVRWVRAKSAPVNYNDVDVDAYGNVYMLGNVQTSITFGATTISSSSGNMYRDFIVSYDSSGSLLWAKGYGEIDFNNTFVSNEGCLLSIAVDKGSVPLIYTAGFFLTPYNANGHIFTSTGAEDAMVIKMDMNGNYLNSFQAGAANLDAFYNIALNSHGEIALGMLYRTSTTINGNNYTAASIYNTMLIKMDTAFTYRWVKNSLVSAQEPDIDIDEYGRCAITDGNDFGISPTTFDFLQVYDSSGTLMFSKSVTGSGSAQFSNMGNHAIAFSKSNYDKLYIAGGYKTQLTIDTTTLICAVAYEEEISVLKFSLPSNGTTTGITAMPPNEVEIYPNPFSDQITISNLRPGELRIVNSLGEIVLKKNLSDTSTSIDLSSFSPGIYVAEFRVGDKTEYRRIVKM